MVKKMSPTGKEHVSQELLKSTSISRPTDPGRGTVQGPVPRSAWGSHTSDAMEPRLMMAPPCPPFSMLFTAAREQKYSPLTFTLYLVKGEGRGWREDEGDNNNTQ